MKTTENLVLVVWDVLAAKLGAVAHRVVDVERDDALDLFVVDGIGPELGGNAERHRA